MRIALIGYGKMGKMLEAAARAGGHTVTAVVDPQGAEPLSLTGARIYKRLDEVENLAEAGAALEFTRPDRAVENLKALAKRKIPTVTGTTGWYDRLDEVKAAVGEAGSSLIWASNFSLGVNLFYRIAWYAARLADPFPEYDAAGFEAHHNKKADSPSGTAKTLVAGVLARMKRKQKPVWDTLNRPPAPEELHYPSLRLGSAPGIHTLIFDSPADTIEITHTARGREGFAAGALLAAQWLTGDGQFAGSGDRRGVFTRDDVLSEILGLEI
ncbi:MAG: 4-hydroxy-tetrahydrodipicolinate reductase [Treponema sp.]|jgi:4-hydroxy-tetrahydrodipicolinate reductase|nr:4-hydroxy-tetrahydrodipicolinate reductase [Treponema sp.]